MDASDPTVAAFLDALPAAARDEASADPDLRRALANAVSTARAAWPELALDEVDFARQLGARLRSDGSVPQALAALHVGDVHLACACAARNETAIAALERDYLGPLDGILARLGAAPDVADEIKQRTRASLLLGDGARPPEVADYAGRGPLRGWLRVMVVRLAGRMLQRHRKSPERGDDALLEVLASVEDPALARVKDAHREHFAHALRDAIASLEPRDRNLLRHEVIDGLTIDQVGTLYGVHRATAARWMGRARERLFRAARKMVMSRLGVDQSEAESIMRLVQTGVDLSVERLLRQDPDA